MISGAVSLRSRRCFSPFPRGTRSLSVARWYLALGGGPPGFARRSTCAALLRIPLGRRGGFRPRGSHPLWRGLPAAWPSRPVPVPRSYQPPGASAGVWAVPLSLAATGGIAFRFLLLRLLRCFTSAGIAPRGATPRGGPILIGPGYPIRTPPDQSALAAPRGLSQPAASFLAPWHQGIHHAPIS